MIGLTDDDLLDYVIEKDFEDTVSRLILKAFELGPKGRKEMACLLRGKRGWKILDKPEYQKIFGRLSQFDEDQVLDFIEGLIRQKLLVEAGARRLDVSWRGREALKERTRIDVQIPWPLPCKWELYLKRRR